MSAMRRAYGASGCRRTRRSVQYGFSTRQCVQTMFRLRRCAPSRSETTRLVKGAPVPASDRPTLSALLARRDLGLELVSVEADLPDGALDRPLRWVHSSDLADPTPFLSEELALLTTGTQFDD